MACEHLYNKTRPTIHEVAHVVGLMVASFLAVPHAQLYYRSLEVEKCEALRNNQGNFDAKMTLSHQTKQGLVWWADSIEGSKNLSPRAPLTSQHILMPHWLVGGATIITKRKVVDGTLLSQNST